MITPNTPGGVGRGRGDSARPHSKTTRRSSVRESFNSPKLFPPANPWTLLVCLDTFRGCPLQPRFASQLIQQSRHDVMNDMAFGGGSEMLREGDQTGHWALLESGIKYDFSFLFPSRRVLNVFVGFLRSSDTSHGLHGSLCLFLAE